MYKKRIWLKYLIIVCIVLFFAMCKSGELKPNVFEAYLPNNGKEIGFIGTSHLSTNDSIQGSLYLKKLTDSTLEYKLGINRNWRYDWLDTEGVAKFDSIIPLRTLYPDTIYNFQRYFARDKRGEIFIYVGMGDAFISVNFDKGNRKISLENSPAFWAK